MSDTAKTTITAKWLLTPTKTELGSKDPHAWTVTNDYREPVYLYVPPGVFVEDSPSEGFHIHGNGGTQVLQLRAEPLRAHGKKSYVVSLKKGTASIQPSGDQPPGDLNGSLDINK